MTNTRILCLDEGHGPVHPMPDSAEGTTALMVNPAASQTVLLDAAAVRVARIVDVTKPYLDLEDAAIDFSREDAIRLLITICAMSQEVGQMLTSAQYHPWGVEPMRRSYREAVKAAEALVEAVNINELKALPEDKQVAITNAIFEMEGNIGAAREDFLGETGDA